ERDGGEVAAEQRVHLHAPVALAAAPRLAVAQLRHVVFDAAAVKARGQHRRDGDQRQRDGDDPACATVDDRRGEPAHRRGAGARLRRTGDDATAVDQTKQPRQEQVRRQPAGERAGRRDHAELVEATEAGGGERRVSGGGGDRGGQRSAPGGARGDGGGFGGGHAAPPLLQVAGEQNDPGVDAVADHDRAEKRRAAAQRRDEQRRHAETPHRADRQRQRQGGERARGAEGEQDRQHHADQHEQGRDRDVRLQRRHLALDAVDDRRQLARPGLGGRQEDKDDGGAPVGGDQPVVGEAAGERV